MFKVREDYYGQITIRVVYAVRTNEDENLEFLLHINNRWTWRDANSYMPV